MFGKRHSNAWLVDTSGFIDDSLLKIAHAGFAPKLLLADIVMDELHMLGDKSDSKKRQKARMALTAIADLRKMDVEFESVRITDLGGDVDVSLLEWSKKNANTLYTTDETLRARALAEGVQAINPYKLMHRLQLAWQKGDQIVVALEKEIKKGSFKAHSKDIPHAHICIDSAINYRTGDVLDALCSRVATRDTGIFIEAKPLSNARKVRSND